ncbi:phosphoenolpyruvate carboxylase [Fretibacter rubidus]|uniref:phosphoenolpyruvate carboxylase n=1 Tax=Fretibacter rubidus TaxID=570162 RepID=UPI00352B15B1
MAYDISKDVEDRKVAFRNIESLVKAISDDGLVARARRLRHRAGIKAIEALDADVEALCEAKAKDGFDAFKSWAEHAAQGIVLTAHPTFSLSRDIRDTLGEIASSEDGEFDDCLEHLKTLPYLPKRAPTLQEEHVDTQATLARMQVAIAAINGKILDTAKRLFPDSWTELTPCLVKIYSWVGYDIDGRTDISWGDALRLRLSEKSVQVQRYLMSAKIIDSAHGFDADGKKAVSELIKQLSNGYESSERDLVLFNQDLTDTDNLVAAANNLTRQSARRLRSTTALYPLIERAIKAAKSDAAKRQLILLRSDLRTYGLGTSRIHFRLNARHVTNAMRQEFGLSDNATDNRTMLLKASKLTKNVKPQPVNFASLALEKSTAHQQMILTAQIHKYIDDETPIRLLIAECEDSLTPLGMLYLARRYGLDKHLDISPLFETASALNNGGRIIDKMLSNPVYRDYIVSRGTFAIQTGFSDAGRFMGQIPATLAIERLQSHFAAAMAKHEMTDVTAIVFNTHGEGMGRGGHPGTLSERVDYVMSPWAMRQFEKRGIPLCHETSFQGGDGFLWFQTDTLARASVGSLIGARFADFSASEDDVFYTDRDFSWDVFRTIGSEQDSLYNDANYVGLLGGFGQNLLIPTGSRAAQRKKTTTDMFNPRQLRAIPHNAILQQFGVPANIFYGVGRATAIDPEKFATMYRDSARARSIFGLVITAMQRSNVSILTAYGRLLDPGFWVSRSLSGNEPRLALKSRDVSKTLIAQPWRSHIMDLANRLRLDIFDSLDFFCTYDHCLAFDNDDNLQILHALRLAVIMKMMIIATDLPAIGPEGTSQLNVLQKLQTLQVDNILNDLKERYPETREALKWTEKLTEKTDAPVAPAGGFPHITETVIKPLERASQLMRQITIAITHAYDAYG